MSVEEHLSVEGAKEEETRNRRDYVGKPKQCYGMVYIIKPWVTISSHTTFLLCLAPAVQFSSGIYFI